ncbi:unnamed protein product [Ixodes hexagonus]
MVRLTSGLRIGTLNVRGLAARRRQCQLSRLLTENDLDVLAVQETKVESESQTDLMVRPFMSRYNVCVSHSVGRSGGCCLFLKKASGIVEENVIACASGRFVICDFSFSNLKWRGICINAPNVESERCAFFENISIYLQSDRITTLLGDFNCVCTPEDRSNRPQNKDKAGEQLNNLVKDFELEDVAQCTSTGNRVIYTHHQGSSHARLDRAYVSVDIVPDCSSYAVSYVSFSDHSLYGPRCCCAVKPPNIIIFTVGHCKNRSSFSWELWKLNAKLLDDKQLTEKVRSRLEQTSSVNDNEMCREWKSFKQQVKLDAIERTCQIKREERKVENGLRADLQRLHVEEGRTPGLFKDDITSIKAKLEQIEEERYKGAIVRARAERLLLGEAPTKRALVFEKKYASGNQIAEIRPLLLGKSRFHYNISCIR